MSTRADVATAIESLGPLDEDILSILQSPEGTWIVRFADFDVECVFDDETRGLSLMAVIGAAHADRLAEIYGTLLKYNLIRRDTGGIVLALTPNDAVVQMLDLIDDRITADLCLLVLRNFVTKARLWRGYVAAERAAPEAQPDELMSFGIRV